MRKALCVSIFSSFFLVWPVVAEEVKEPFTVEVTAPRVESPSQANITTGRLRVGDPAAVLDNEAGIYRYSGGGISSLPVVHGLNDDRVKVVVDGAPLTSACGNHMNPPLSYVDPAAVSDYDVQSIAPPVSAGGDNLAGTIAVKSAPPVFAKPGEKLLKHARVSSIYRSNNDAITESVAAGVANEELSIDYIGSYNRGNSYIDGHGDKVRATQYEAWNNAITISARGDDNLLTLKGSLQEIPYQGYVNQYMDMVQNRGRSLNLTDSAKVDWGTVDAQFFWQETKHEMGFFSREKLGEMPMNVDGEDIGYSLKTDINLNAQNVLRVGNQLHRFELDDRWPAVPGSMMMGPNTFVNINNGHRQLFDNFAEWEFKPSTVWSTLLGARSSLVSSDTGEVQPYQSMAMTMMEMDSGMDMMGGEDLDAANAFNAADRSRHDNNLDLTARATFAPTSSQSYQLGYTRKTRSPNLYERYAWGRGTMAMAMIGWFGDANGYVGNLDLDPETAHTISASVALHDDTQSSWRLQVTPYFTYVEDYIDVDSIGSFNPGMSMDDTKSLLRFANHDARISGVDLTGSVQVWEGSDLGRLQLKGLVGWIHGERVDSGDSLYHMMPFNGRISLQQDQGGWNNGVELLLVDEKSRVDSQRRELPTSGYVIVNLLSSYRWDNFRINVGVTNLFDKFYYLPLGGVDYADWKADGGMGQMHAVPGPGRSFNAGFTMEF